MGYCTFPGCKNTKQGCFRNTCKFVPTVEYTAFDAFTDLKMALQDAEEIYSDETTAIDAINYIKQRLEQIQRA